MAEDLFWVRPDGGTLQLHDYDNSSGTPYSVKMGVDGRFAPLYTIVAEPMYNVPGDVPRLVTTKVRTIAIPIQINGTSAADLRSNVRLLTDAFDPNFGLGRLRAVTEDGFVYLMNGYVESFDLPEKVETGAGTNTFRLTVATFTSHDVYWYDPNESDVYIDGYTDMLTYPFQLYNAGSVIAWPIWAICGSMTAVTITNETTGKHITANASLGDYSRLYIDTRQLTRATLLNHNINAATSLSTDSVSFPLVPGYNKISCVFTGATAATSVRARWIHRYNGAAR